jgi:CDP-2,3-bis-(O-geranylgeranyl)-sn-glycerol synthase
MHFLALAQVLILLSLANASPVIAKLFLGKTYARPIDGNTRFIDGRPLFGPSKTIRGLVVSLLLTALAAPLIGLQFKIGLLEAAAAMAGDLLSSFSKRGWVLHPVEGDRARPNSRSALPLLACRSAFSLTAIDIAAGCVIFFVGEVLLSYLFFRLRLRDRRY